MCTLTLLLDPVIRNIRAALSGCGGSVGVGGGGDISGTGSSTVLDVPLLFDASPCDCPLPLSELSPSNAESKMDPANIQGKGRIQVGFLLGCTGEVVVAVKRLRPGESLESAHAALTAVVRADGLEVTPRDGTPEPLRATYGFGGADDGGALDEAWLVLGASDWGAV